MRTFRVTVNGNSYDVSVEEFSGAQAASSPAPAPAPAPAPQATPSAAKPKANVSGTKVTAPMPGKILAVKTEEGTAVKKGDVLLTLEAMKMENEIVSPVDGKIEHIAVKKGAGVETGDLLLSIV